MIHILNSLLGKRTLAIVLLVVLGFGMFQAQAQAYTISEDEKCTVRPTVSGGEIDKLTGGVGVVVSSDNTVSSSTASSEEITERTEIALVDKDGNPIEGGTVCVYSTIQSLTGILSLVIASIAVVMFIVAGYLFVTSQGETDKTGTAKKILVTSVIGVVIALIAWVFPSIIVNFI